MVKKKTNIAFNPEAYGELERIAGMWGLKRNATLEQIIFYVGAICTQSIDDSVMDAALRRQAEAKIEYRS